MLRLNLEEKTLALNILGNHEHPNCAEVARVMSEQLNRVVYPDSIRRLSRRNNIPMRKQGRPKKVDDSELERCFNKYHSSQNISVYHAAQKAAKELGYAFHTAVLYRWRKMYLI